MSLTIRSAQTVGNGVKLRGNNTQVIVPPTSSIPVLFELDASIYASGTTLLDISGNDRHATISGGLAWDSEAGGCFVFNNNYTQYIEVPGSSEGWGLNSAGDNPSASFSVWAKVTNNLNYQHIAGWRGGFNFWFLVLPNSVVEARFDGGTPQDIGMDYTPYFDTWAYTTFVVDSANSQTRLYINSVLVGTYDGITGSFGTGASNYILGCVPGNAWGMAGKIGGTTAYSRALTQQEVISEFNRTKSRYGL
jgi:hypothetical protein